MTTIDQGTEKMAESWAAAVARREEHLRTKNQQKTIIIPREEATVADAKLAHGAGLLSADPATFAVLKAAVGVAQDNLETEQHRLAAMERLTPEIEAQVRDARIREHQPIAEEAKRKYVTSCASFHQNLADAEAAVRGADEAIAVLNTCRHVGVDLPDVIDLQPTHAHPGQVHPKLRRLLMTAEAATNMLRVS